MRVCAGGSKCSFYAVVLLILKVSWQARFKEPITLAYLQAAPIDTELWPFYRNIRNTKQNEKRTYFQCYVLQKVLVLCAFCPISYLCQRCHVWIESCSPDCVPVPSADEDKYSLCLRDFGMKCSYLCCATGALFSADNPESQMLVALLWETASQRSSAICWKLSK